MRTNSIVTSAGKALVMAAMALTAMAGCARVSTEHVQKTSDRLARPVLILVHDYQVSPDEVQLDSALSSRFRRAVKHAKDRGSAQGRAGGEPDPDHHLG